MGAVTLLSVVPATHSSLSHAGQEQSRVQKSPCFSRDALGNGAGIHLVQLSLKSAFLGALQDKISNSGGHSARTFSPWCCPLLGTPSHGAGQPQPIPFDGQGCSSPAPPKLHLEQAVHSRSCQKWDWAVRGDSRTENPHRNHGKISEKVLRENSSSQVCESGLGAGSRLVPAWGSLQDRDISSSATEQCCDV